MLQNSLKVKVLVLAALCLFLSSACVGRAGEGTSLGIVTSVEHFAGWGADYDRIWFRASEQTSQTDCYVLEPDIALLKQLKELSRTREFVQISFYRYRVLSAQTFCSVDAVYAVEPVKHP